MSRSPGRKEIVQNQNDSSTMVWSPQRPINSYIVINSVGRPVENVSRSTAYLFININENVFTSLVLTFAGKTRSCDVMNLKCNRRR